MKTGYDVCNRNSALWRFVCKHLCALLPPKHACITVCMCNTQFEMPYFRSSLSALSAQCAAMNFNKALKPCQPRAGSRLLIFTYNRNNFNEMSNQTTFSTLYSAPKSFYLLSQAMIEISTFFVLGLKENVLFSLEC